MRGGVSSVSDLLGVAISACITRILPPPSGSPGWTKLILTSTPEAPPHGGSCKQVQPLFLPLSSLSPSTMGCGGSKHAAAAAGEANDRRRRLLLPKRLSSSGKISPAPEESPSRGKNGDGETREAGGVATLSEKHTGKAGGGGEREDQEGEKMESIPAQFQDVSPSRCRKNDAQVDTLRRQLQQLAEEFARFEAWGSKEDENPNSKEEEEEGEEEEEDDDDEEDRDNPFRTPRTERESTSEEESSDQEQDQIQFEEDFSNKIPVYDEYPFDLLQNEVPSVAGDFCIQADTTAPHLSIEKRGSDDGQIEQITPCRRTVEARRSRPGGGEDRKRRIHHQLHGGKIRKQRRRKIRALHRRAFAGATD